MRHPRSLPPTPSASRLTQVVQRTPAGRPARVGRWTPARRRVRVARRIASVLAASALGVSLVPGLGAAAVAATAAYRSADDGAAVTAVTQIDASTFDVTVNSPALADTVQVRVLVPAGWSRTAKRTWPVLYAYHGGRDDYHSWTRSTDIAAWAAAYNVMVVTPEGGQHGSYTNWWNSGKGGIPKWETFHTKEVLQLMERNFRAGTSRAAMGISSGAGGAVYYAAAHPGMFKFVASYSGVLHLTQAGVPAILMSEALLLDEPGQNSFLIWGIPGIPKDDANWRAHDPYVLAAGLRGTGIFLSSGTTGLPGPYEPSYASALDFAKAEALGGGTEAMVGSTNKSFVARLQALKIPFTADLYGNGWHQWLYWNREMHKSWTQIMKAIGAKQVAPLPVATVTPPPPVPATAG